MKKYMLDNLKNLEREHKKEKVCRCDNMEVHNSFVRGSPVHKKCHLFSRKKYADVWKFTTVLLGVLLYIKSVIYFPEKVMQMYGSSQLFG